MSSRGRKTPRDRSSSAPGVYARPLLRAALLAALSLFSITWSSTSHAYPWMIQHGFAKCASCHTDPMGGETLTGFGRVMSDTTLSTRWDGSKDPTKNAELFFALEEPRALSLGGSFRMMDALYQFPRGNQSGKFTAFPMQMDVYGEVRPIERLRLAGSIGATEVRPSTVYGHAAQITKNNGGNPNDRRLNVLSRSHWIGYDVTDEILVRAGRMNLPFGVRIPEHYMWVRAGSRTDRESNQQHGIAASYSAGRIRAELMGILGNYQISPDKFRERGYSLYAEYLLGLKTALGVSSLITHANDDLYLQNGKSMLRQAHGLTARVSPVEHLAVLAEADLLLSNQTTTGYLGMLQGDYELVQGLHASATGEIEDLGKSNVAGTPSIAGAGKAKLGGWLTLGWFFFTHFDARVDMIFREQEPVTLLSQIHYYL